MSEKIRKPSSPIKDGWKFGGSNVVYGHCNRESPRGGDFCSHEGSPNHGVTHFDFNTGYRWREERRIEPDIAEQLILGNSTESEIRAAKDRMRIGANTRK